MSHNKGKHYVKCPECQRKRYCLGERLPYYYWQWTCSKGHKWLIKQGQEAQIVQLEMDRIIPQIKNLFDRDDIFFKHLKNK